MTAPELLKSITAGIVADEFADTVAEVTLLLSRGGVVEVVDAGRVVVGMEVVMLTTEVVGIEVAGAVVGTVVGRMVEGGGEEDDTPDPPVPSDPTFSDDVRDSEV